MTELLTQNADWTQLDGDDEEDDEANSAPANNSTINAPKPWGRLMANSNHSTGQIIALYPRPPQSTRNSLDENNNISRTLLPFNEYSIGRSTKCDVCVESQTTISTSATTTKTTEQAEKRHRARREWCHGLISNQHCKLYCTNSSTTIGRSTTAQGTIANATTTAAPRDDPFNSINSNTTVWIEDCSGNGTVINGTIRLRMGEKRQLHSGDEIGLMARDTIQRKFAPHEQDLVDSILQQYSYIFVMAAVVPVVATIPTTATNPTILGGKPQHSFPPIPRSLMASVQHRAGGLLGPMRPTAAVDARATCSTRGGARGRDSILSPDSHGRLSLSQSSSCQDQKQRRISPRRQPQRRIEQEYDIRDTLGQGTMGEVRRAIHRQSGQVVAVKILSLMRQRGPWNQCAELEREAAILRQLDHPYVVKLFDVFFSSQAIYLVMELVAGGDLFDRIMDKGCYSELDSRRVMRRLLAAVHYLHESSGLHIVHRDLKPENILLVSTASDIEVKLTDFGLAKPDGDLKTFCGTPQYFAPVCELNHQYHATFSRKHDAYSYLLYHCTFSFDVKLKEVLRRRHTVKGNGRYGKQADMWSLGVILYVLLTGMPPFDTDDGCSSSSQPGILEFPSNISEQAQDMVRQLLQPDPRQRATVSVACLHAWILTPDGDTHEHPLNDPKLPTTDILSEHSCIEVFPERPNESSDDHLVTVKAAPEETNALMSNSVDLLTTCVRVSFGDSKEQQGITMDEAMDQKFDSTNRISLDAGAHAPAENINPPEEKLMTGLKDLISATNYSFHQELSPVICWNYKTSSDHSKAGSMKAYHGPLSPATFNAELTKMTPRASIFYPKLQSSTIGSDINDGEVVILETKPNKAAMAITPNSSNVRLAEPELTIAPIRVDTERELEDEEICSDFSDNNESISSYSTVALDVNENKYPPPMMKSTEANSRHGHKKRKRKTSVTGDSLVTKPRSVKREKSPSGKLNSVKKTRKEECLPSSKSAGGKQTTLNNWFKKHN